MKVWQCDDLRPVPGLVSAEVKTPQPGRGEVLIRVHAVGVTHTELLWQPTTHTKSGENRRHAIPGHEFSGTIAAVGAGADGAVGEEVFGMNDWYAQGATAEFCCAPPSAIALKPARLTHVEAASVPIDALTAWQGLFERAQLQAGERVLIHGGAGAVGVLAIQLARLRGAHVLTTASGHDRDFLLQLGAQQVIDYHTERFEDLARNVDVVFDAVGGSTLQRLLGRAGFQRKTRYHCQHGQIGRGRTHEAGLVLRRAQSAAAGRHRGDAGRRPIAARSQRRGSLRSSGGGIRA